MTKRVAELDYIITNNWKVMKHCVLLNQCLVFNLFRLILYAFVLLEKPLSSFWRDQMKSKSMFCNGKRYDEKIHACMFNVSLLSLPWIEIDNQNARVFYLSVL